MDGAGWFELVALGVGEGDDAVVVLAGGGVVGDVAAKEIHTQSPRLVGPCGAIRAMPTD